MLKINPISNDFFLSEFTYSRTAVENGIDNSPGEKEIASLRELVSSLLQPLRDTLGEPIAITSGYRNVEVNRLSGGVPDSQHTLGEAADCYTERGPERLLEILLKSGLEFDQAIVYKRKNFLHLSYRKGRNRKQVIMR